MYYVYMLRCEDNSIYTGITTNIERRMQEHLKKLEIIWEVENRKEASKLEYFIKTLKKEQKEELIKDKR